MLFVFLLALVVLWMAFSFISQKANESDKLLRDQAAQEVLKEWDYESERASIYKQIITPAYTSSNEILSRNKLKITNASQQPHNLSRIDTSLLTGATICQTCRKGIMILKFEAHSPLVSCNRHPACHNWYKVN